MAYRNTGQIPAFEAVDIKYRGGTKVLGIDPDKRRWTIADPAFGGESAFDIIAWQPAGPARVERESDAA
jgi:hypothetical protein